MLGGRWHVNGDFLDNPGEFGGLCHLNADQLTQSCNECLYCILH